MDCARNIITANFSGGKTHATTARAYQWSRGIELCITGADNLPQTFKAHFSVQKRGGVATTIVGIDERVDVPNVLFTIGKDIHVWLGASETEDDAEILYTVDIPVAPAPMPEYYDAEDTGVFDAVVEQVADYAATATAAANSAGASATAAAGSASAAAASASSAAGSAGAAEQARADAVTAKGQAETAAQTATEKAQQTAQNASQAALDAGRAESAAERAESAETGAGAAKTAAEAAAQSAAASAATADEKATLAGQSATAAAGSASAAAQSAASIEGDVQIASQKASEAQTAAGQAVTAKDAAVTAQQGAETAATNAGQSASTATAKAAEAATSASNAAQSKTDAEAAAARAEQAAATLTVDSALSDSSTNPVQNKVVTAELTDVKTAINQAVSTTEEIAVDGFSESNASTANPGTAPFVFDRIQYDFTGCKVTSVKLKGLTAGVVSLGTIKKTSVVSATTADRTAANIKATIDIVTGLQTANVSSPFEVASDEYLFIGFPGDTGKWTYGSHGMDTHFYYVSGTGLWSISGNSVGITVYTEKYELSENIQEAIDSVTTIKNFLGFGEATTTTVYKSIAENAGSGSNSSLSPFILNRLDYSNAPYSITGIRMNIAQAGVLTVGRVLKSKVAVGNTFNIDDFSDSQTIDIASTGVQDIPLTPVEITNDYYLFVNLPGDTVRFYYGGSETGLDTIGFIYPSNGGYIIGNSYIGVDMIATSDGTPSNVRDAVNSIYKDKKLSILGDSISTFSGYIPEGNATYYPSGTVTSVKDTWWYKLYTALGMTLDTNNSWSGSRVTTTGGEASAGCMTRCQNLGSPDVIIVWMGINDFNNEVQLGTYDGTSALPSATTTFREAYAVMLNKILTAYRSAEIWVCTLPQCERNAETGFPELNGNGDSLFAYNKAIRELADAFGVRVLEHNKCGLTYQNMPVYNPDKLHPNKYGHSLVANNDIWQMDGTVARRYPVS